VYRQGDPADSVFYIRSGKVKATVVSEQGKEAVVALLGADDFFGEGCLAGQPLRLSTASAMTQCVIVRIAKADITRVIHEEPAFAELFISHLLARNSRVEEDLVDQLFNSSEKRLARTFCFWRILARKVGRSHHSENQPRDTGGDDRHDTRLA
jgi:cAMP-binding proteins - catabolite gene activator and regulatory subunit of cAMP-dependent protein kinases